MCSCGAELCLHETPTAMHRRLAQCHRVSPHLHSSLPDQILEAFRKYSRLVSTQLCLSSFRHNGSFLQHKSSQDPNERMDSQDVPELHLGLVDPSSILILQVPLERLPGAVGGWGASPSSLPLARGTRCVCYFSK